MSKEMKMELLEDPDVRTVLIGEITKKMINKILGILIIAFIISICIICMCVFRDLSLLLLLIPVSTYYFSHKEVLVWR